jgi:hypothetical protein
LAMWKAIEESIRTPVTSSFLPSSNMGGLSLGSVGCRAGGVGGCRTGAVGSGQ